MTQTQLPSNKVFARCELYAFLMKWEWELKDAVGYITIPNGFLSSSVVRVALEEDDEHEESLFLATSVAAEVPHAFLHIAHALAQRVERFVICEGDSILWCAKFNPDMCDSEEAMDNAFDVLLREVFVAQSLLQLYRDKWREVPITSVLGLGFETEFDIEH